MKIEEKSDSEILKIAESMWDEIVEGCRAKDWVSYSQFFTEDDRSDPEHKKDILNQWENNPVLVSIQKEKQFLSILRRENEVVVVWRFGSTAVNGEFMGSLHLAVIDSAIRVIGVGLH
ncbi:hypothetical protein [Pseudomaricurvus sp.]|uniref:hypothetical protein n=1 Tax=Pseudomaricurvus sp. TaxID=2004510 RepID=UPI003F6C9D8B